MLESHCTRVRKRVNEVCWVNCLRKSARNQLSDLRLGRRQLVFTSPKETLDQIGGMIEQIKEDVHSRNKPPTVHTTSAPCEGRAKERTKQMHIHKCRYLNEVHVNTIKW